MRRRKKVSNSIHVEMFDISGCKFYNISMVLLSFQLKRKKSLIGTPLKYPS